MAIHLRIVGVVQGVGYRASFAAHARNLQLSGWVKNRVDGSVEALVCGPTETVDALVKWAWQGPPAAQVRSVEISEAGDAGKAAATASHGRFEILPTD